VVDARPLDGDDDVGQGVLVDRPADRGDHGIEALAVVLDDGGRDEDAAVEVGEHPLGAGLGAIDSDDAEVLGPDRPDAGVERPGRLGEAQVAAPSRHLGLACRGHENTSWDRDVGGPDSRRVVRMAQREELFLSK
jgi:hypothetical protein